MKLVVMTDDERWEWVFEKAEEMDYMDYSAELDDAMADAIRAEGRAIPWWLK